jgi:hypothetical protein
LTKEAMLHLDLEDVVSWYGSLKDREACVDGLWKSRDEKVDVGRKPLR